MTEYPEIEMPKRSLKKRICDHWYRLLYLWYSRRTWWIDIERYLANCMPEPKRTKHLQRLLQKVEKKILKLCWDEQRDDFSTKSSKQEDDAKDLIRYRYSLLDQLFTWSADEICILEEQDNYFKTLMTRLFSQHTDAVEMAGKQSERLRQIYYASVESTLNYYPSTSEKIQTLDYYADIHERYPSDFYRMHFIISALDDIDAVRYDTGTNQDGTFQEPEDCWNDGTSWAEARLHDPRLEHITFSYLSHALYTHSDYALVDLLLMREFRFDTKVEYTDYNEGE